MLCRQIDIVARKYQKPDQPELIFLRIHVNKNLISLISASKGKIINQLACARRLAINKTQTFRNRCTLYYLRLITILKKKKKRSCIKQRIPVIRRRVHGTKIYDILRTGGSIAFFGDYDRIRVWSTSKPIYQREYTDVGTYNKSVEKSRSSPSPVSV